jgi:O-acetyl-ADP-ribose deacetylase (regulator of RNase III)
MPTSFVKGNFLDESEPITGPRAIAFGADVAGQMDAGIAVAVKKRWPATEAWWAACCAGGKAQLGEARAWKDGSHVVYALALQKQGGRVKISWLESAVAAMLEHAAKNDVTRICVPRLWGGATGLDGDRAKRVLQEAGNGSGIQLVVFEQFIRAASDPKTPE